MVSDQAGQAPRRTGLANAFARRGRARYGPQVGHVEVAHVSHVLPDGRQLLDDASFKIPEGATAAIVGPNGAGKPNIGLRRFFPESGGLLSSVRDGEG